jgi:hypothetical protein
VLPINYGYIHTHTHTHRERERERENNKPEHSSRVPVPAEIKVMISSDRAREEPSEVQLLTLNLRSPVVIGNQETKEVDTSNQACL